MTFRRFTFDPRERRIEILYFTSNVFILFFRRSMQFLITLLNLSRKLLESIDGLIDKSFYQDYALAENSTIVEAG